MSPAKVSRRFLTWLKKVAGIHRHVQHVRDSRKPGQTDYPPRQMAMVAFFRALLDSRTNGLFFDVELESKALRKVLGFGSGKVCDQSTFERTLPRFNILSLRALRRKVLATLRRAKVFGGRTVVAVDATEISVPDGSYEGCGVRQHGDDKPVFFYKLVYLVLVGPGVPPIILGARVTGSSDELDTARSLIRETVAELGHRAIDVIVADRLYVGYEFANEMKNEHGIDVILEPKNGMNVLIEGKQLLDVECRTSRGTLSDGSSFRLRELDDISQEWKGLKVGPLRFIEAHQEAPWPDERGQRRKQTRYIVTTLRYGTAEWVNRCLHWRWWIEADNWSLKHRFHLSSLPSRQLPGIQAYVEFLALAFTLFNAFLQRQLGGFEALGKTLTSVFKLLTRWLFALDPDEAIDLTVLATG